MSMLSWTFLLTYIICVFGEHAVLDLPADLYNMQVFGEHAVLDLPADLYNMRIW